MSQDPEHGEVLRALSAKETEARRQAYVVDRVLPLLQKMFRDEPAIRSAVLMFAQYWSDEAQDAVHGHLAFSLSDTPDTEAWLNTLTDHSEAWEYKWLIEGVRSGVAAGVAFLGEGRPLGRCPYDIRWDSNSSAIPLFAAFCCEGGHQEKSLVSNYTPYATLRRQDDSVKVEVTGTMLRPWLDGIRRDGS